MYRTGLQEPVRLFLKFDSEKIKMTKHQYEHKHQAIMEQEVSDVRVPYWHRAHRDWRFISVVFLMHLAITVYLLTGDLAWVRHGQPMPLLQTGQ